MNITEISNGKTRVLMFGLSPEVSKLTFHILNYHGKIYDYYSNNLQNIDGNDFFILETHSESDIQNFPPTIAFFGIKHQLENYHPILEQITAGGIVIYPEFVRNIDNAVLQTLNYFRKMDDGKPERETENGNVTLKTDFGNVPISITDEDTIFCINGVKHFAQQFGIMEEEFYEALSAY